MKRKYLRKVASFTLVGAGTFLAVIPVWADVHGWQWVAIAFVCAGILSVIGSFPSLLREIQVRQFFGVGNAKLISLVVATYQPRREYDPAAHTDEFLFKKTYRGDTYPLRAVASSIGASTAIYAAEAVAELGSLCSSRVLVVPDQGVSGDLARISGGVVSMGSPTSNFFTHEALSDIPDKYTPKFTSTKLLWGGQEYESDVESDFAVIVRISTDGRVVCICAGIDEEGTVAAMHHLLNNWDEMPRSWRIDTSFVQIYGVRKQDRQVRNLVASARQVSSSLSWTVDHPVPSRSSVQ